MSPERATLTRRQFLALSGAAVGAAIAPRAAAGAVGERHAVSAQDASGAPYVSRPDLRPPAVTITQRAEGTSPGYVMLAPFDISGTAPGTTQHGPLIVDDAGEPVWFRPLAKVSAMDFRVQRYRGKPVLTWYEGQVLGPYGGTYVVADTSYRQLMRIKAGDGYQGDLHEFLVTTRGTALIAIYDQVHADLSSIGGSSSALVVQGVVQELALPGGQVLFEWHSLDHVGPDESFRTEVTNAGNVDYFHLNSINVDLDGNLLVSARHTSTVYKIDRQTGDVIWRLGGKKSDFAIDPDATFSYQHDARRHPDGTLTIFDNAAADPPTGDTGDATSKPMRIALDMTTMQAKLVEVLTPPQPRLAWAMGNLQQLPDGGSFVGWGTAGLFTEFTPAGEVRLDGGFADSSVSYRAFRFPWVGRPSGLPAVAVRPGEGGAATVYASWNGATQIDRWQIWTGASAASLRPVHTGRRTGFETAMTVPKTGSRLAVAALDSRGRELGRSRVVRV